jgi:hypothetical protein
MLYMSVRWDLRVPEGLARDVDVARGDVSRARFVIRALEEALGAQGDPGVRSVGSSPPASPPAPRVPRAASFNVGPRPFTEPRPKQ